MVERLEDYAVFTTNVEGEVSSGNGAAERLPGYPEGEMTGRPTALLYTAQVLTEREHSRKDRSRFWAAGKVFPLLDEENRLREFTLIPRDVTADRCSVAEHQARLSRIFNA